jgi:hypothetical protein
MENAFHISKFPNSIILKILGIIFYMVIVFFVKSKLSK